MHYFSLQDYTSITTQTAKNELVGAEPSKAASDEVVPPGVQVVLGERSTNSPFAMKRSAAKETKKCHVCAKYFKRNANLKSHMR